MTHRSFAHRRAFTIIELLVVFAVVAILTAIFLPAVEQTRAQARLSACKNNLKQLAISMHNYHDVFATFPPGWVTKDPTFDRTTGYGWQAMLLPYLDQAPLYDQIDFKNPPKEPNKLLQTKIDVLRCPSDNSPALNKLRGNYATSNYSGNFGSKSLPRWLPDGMSEFWPGRVNTPVKSNGILWVNSSCRFRDIVDGSSNTFMASERSVSSGAGIWMGVTANNHENDAVTDCSHASRLNHSVSSFSSRHASGANFMLCDGSVRFVSNKVDSQSGREMGTYQKLGSRNDRQPVGPF